MTAGVTSYGYAAPGGTIMPNAAWANWQKCAGARYMVDSVDDAVITPVAGGVHVGLGIIGGQGILDEITTVQNLSWSAPASGTQYAILKAVRTWQTTQQTSFALQTVGATLPATMPALTNTSPGVIDDQPLALLSLASNDTIPRLVKDLRAIGGPNFYVMQAGLDQNWFGYMTQPGVTIYSGTVTWRRLLDPISGNETWERDPELVRAGPGLGNPLSVAATFSGWATTSQLESRGSRSDNDMKLLLQINHSTSSNPLAFTDSVGGVVGGDKTICTVGNTAWRPPYDIPGILFDYLGTDNASYTGSARYTAAGAFVVTAGVHSTSVGVKSDGSWSIRALINWTREG